MFKTILLISSALITVQVVHAQIAPTPSPIGDVSKNTVTAAGGTVARTLANRATDKIYAPDYGNCIWDGSSSHDVGPCINAAIAVAATLQGAVVTVPGGTFYAATNITVNNSGVQIQAAGWGKPRDRVVNTTIQVATKIIYNGSAEAGPFMEFTTTGLDPLVATGLSGIGIDCGSLVDTCVHINTVIYSTFAFTQAGARKSGVLFDTGSVSPGNQWNDVWISTNNINPSYNASGIVLDKGVGSSSNTSYNHFHLLYAAYNGGDGIVRGANDSNVYDVIQAYKYGTLTTGSPVVDTNTAYTPPSGVPTHNYSNDNLTLFTGAPIWHQGFTNGTVFTAGDGNAGTLVYAPVTLTTNAASAVGTSTLSFASVSGVTASQGVTCGGVSSGIYPNTYVTTTTATTIGLARPPLSGGGFSGVASGQSCTFGLLVNGNAATGTYTITATSGTTVSVTAPTGGTTQASVAISGGAIKATDFTIPVTGTPVSGDTFTLTVPQPTVFNRVIQTDKSNSISDPDFEPGATGWGTYGGGMSPAFFGNSSQCMSLFSLNGAALPGTSCTGYGGVYIGQSGNASGINPVVIGGSNNFVNNSSTNGVIVSGGTNTVGGNYSGIFGGLSATDRGRRGTLAFAAGTFSVQGDAQTTTTVLRGNGSSTSAIRLTNDGLTAGSTNCINIPNNTVYSISIDLMSTDHTTYGKAIKWTNYGGLLGRGATASTTTLTMDGTPTPVTLGTMSGASISVTADTTNGCVNLSFTPQTGNTDQMNVVAYVRTIEGQ